MSTFLSHGVLDIEIDVQDLTHKYCDFEVGSYRLKSQVNHSRFRIMYSDTVGTSGLCKIDFSDGGLDLELAKSKNRYVDIVFAPESLQTFCDINSDGSSSAEEFECASAFQDYGKDDLCIKVRTQESVDSESYGKLVNGDSRVRMLSQSSRGSTTFPTGSNLDTSVELERWANYTNATVVILPLTNQISYSGNLTVYNHFGKLDWIDKFEEDLI